MTGADALDLAFARLLGVTPTCRPINYSAVGHEIARAMRCPRSPDGTHWATAWGPMTDEQIGRTVINLFAAQATP